MILREKSAPDNCDTHANLIDDGDLDDDESRGLAASFRNNAIFPHF
jgi:hypothetical protein